RRFRWCFARKASDNLQMKDDEAHAGTAPDRQKKRYFGMSTTLEPPPHETLEPDLHSFEHHWQDEADAAFLYRILAAAEPDQHKKDVYSRLAEVEDRHVVVWGDLMKQHGHPPKP